MATRRLTAAERDRILELLRDGTEAAAIAESLGVTTRQVAAVAAHLTMNTYGRESHRLSDVSASKLAYPESRAAPETSETIQIAIGFDAQTGEVRSWSPTPDLGTPNPHLMILGESGSGKTYASQCLCAELVHKDLPTIVFDFGQGFSLQTSTKEFVETARPIEIRGGQDGININPLQIFPGDLHGPINVAQRVADTFARVYPAIGIQQHAALRDAILRTFSDVGVDPATKSTWTREPPRFSDLKLALDTLASDRRAAAHKVTGTVASHISAVFLFNTFRSSGLDLDWRKILQGGGRTYIVQLKGLETSLERVVTELLIWNLIGYAESLGPARLRALVLLDEAHRLSFSADSPVEKLLREGRKFGLGVILASQQPEDFSPVAFANTASKLIFNVSDPRGAISREIMRKNSPSANAVLRQLGRLQRGEACFLSLNYASVVKILDFSQRIARWSGHGQLSRR